jgi:hypothetical protein
VKTEAFFVFLNVLYKNSDLQLKTPVAIVTRSAPKYGAIKSSKYFDTQYYRNRNICKENVK